MAGKKIGLLIYGLHVRNNMDKRINLNEIMDNITFIELVKRYIEENITKYLNDSTKETFFQFDKIETEVIKNKDDQEEYEVLCGMVKTGEYGVESDLVNIETREIYHKTVKEADMMPFGFCIAVPRGKVELAVILFQTIGVLGMKLSLQTHLQKCIANVNTDLRLVLRAITPKEYIDRYFNKGVLKKIRMVRYEIPQDVSDRVGINYGVKNTKEEYTIYRPAGFMERNKNKIIEWQKGQRSHTEIVELDDYKYDDMKFEFSLNGGNKTFDLGNMDSLVVSEDITKDVTKSGGNPVFSSLVIIMKKYAREYLVGMGILIE